MIGRNERGQVAILAIGLAFIASCAIGLAVDGTRAFLYRRTLQNAADSAVLAAASEIDRGLVYATSRPLRLDRDGAETRATEWLRERGLHSSTVVSVDPDGVSLVLRGTVSTSFLRLVGIQELPVAVESAARPFP